MYGVYSRILEAKCRYLGYKIKRVDEVSFYSGGVLFKGTTGATDKAKEICRNKSLTHEYALSSGVEVPKHYVIRRGERIERLLDFPLVVKPNKGSLGRKVFLNIKSEEEFNRCVKSVLDSDYESLVEEYVTGTKYRVFVTDKKVVSVIKYDAPAVVGNGTSDVNSLITFENRIRKNRNLVYLWANFPNLLVDVSFLEEQGYSLTSILPKGEVLPVNKMHSRATGAKSTEVADTQTRKEFYFCAKAISSIPGLKSSGVDAMVEDGTGRKLLLEVNGVPHLRANLWPLVGEPKPVAKELVSAYLGGYL